MGRYYGGDIEGKFMFGVQDSRDGEFFGARDTTQNEIQYVVYRDEREELFEGIKECKKELGLWFLIFDRYFDYYYTFNDDKIISYIERNQFKVNSKEWKEKIKWYARIELGFQMRNFFRENPNRDELDFWAELE